MLWCAKLWCKLMFCCCQSIPSLLNLCNVALIFRLGERELVAHNVSKKYLENLRREAWRGRRTSVERGKTYQEILAERSQDLENGFETSASLGLCVKQFENGQRIEDLENMVCNDPPLRLPPLQCPQQSGSYNCSWADLPRLPSLGSRTDVIFSFEEKESKVSARSKLIVEIYVFIRTDFKQTLISWKLITFSIETKPQCTGD